MRVTDEQATTLRTYLAGDFEGTAIVRPTRADCRQSGI
jgi:hypothetical protein